MRKTEVNKLIKLMRAYKITIEELPAFPNKISYRRWVKLLMTIAKEKLKHVEVVRGSLLKKLSR